MMVDNKTPTRDCYSRENFKQEMRKSIADGTLQSDDNIEIFAKKDEDWDTEIIKVREFASSFNTLRALYQPVWTYALIGLKWEIYWVWR